MQSFMMSVDRSRCLFLILMDVPVTRCLSLLQRSKNQTLIQRWKVFARLCRLVPLYRTLFFSINQIDLFCQYIMMKVMSRVFSVVYCFLCLHIVPWFLGGHRDRKGSLVWILAQRQTDSQTMTFLLYKSIYLTICWLPQLI